MHFFSKYCYVIGIKYSFVGAVVSVVERELDGRSYLHVRRKVKRTQKQRFFPIDGLSPEEIAVKRHEAKKLDEEWEREQEPDSLSLVFWSDGVFKYIRVLEPNKKNGWRIKAQKVNGFNISRSIDTNGFDSAFNDVFNKIIKHFGFSMRSINMKVIKAICFSSLKSEYQIKKRERDAKKREKIASILVSMRKDGIKVEDLRL